MPRTIHFVSLGCAKNRVDTEVMLGVAGVTDHAPVDDPADADVIVVNTCGFIGPAKEESVDTILEMAEHKEAGRCETLVVAGCLSQRYPDQLATEMPEVDHFLGSSDMLKLGPVLRREAKERMLVGNPAEYTMRATDPRTLTERGHSAYVKIAEGCNRRCSFCAIPSFRGDLRSRSLEDLVEEAKRLAEAGVVELNLVSQDTVAWGRDDKDSGSRLADLAAALGDVDGISWVRIHYLYPEKLTTALLDVMADHPAVLPYVDMPLQHAATNVLKRMRRGHGEDRLRGLVERLRGRLRDMVFRTTFLVGHPGETDADFEALLEFVRWAELDHVGVFVFSPEDATPAAAMEGAVEEKVARRRRRALMRVQRPISRERLKARIGTEIDVLVDGVSEEHEYLLAGRWWGQAPEVDGKVLLANGDAQPGELRRALVTNAADYDLVADLYTPEGAWAPPPGTRRPRKRKIKLRTLQR
ncbi:MAG: 30S ribosomal protein S12 methylthiotransferase RimO [Myxococcota bacterium]